MLTAIAVRPYPNPIRTYPTAITCGAANRRVTVVIASSNSITRRPLSASRPPYTVLDQPRASTWSGSPATTWKKTTAASVAPIIRRANRRSRDTTRQSDGCRPLRNALVRLAGSAAKAIVPNPAQVSASP
jgi:hypothetical protein